MVCTDKGKEGLVKQAKRRKVPGITKGSRIFMRLPGLLKNVFGTDIVGLLFVIVYSRCSLLLRHR